jgi:hypothetical protein
MKKLSTRFEVSASNFWVRNVKTNEVGQKCQSRLYRKNLNESNVYNREGSALQINQSDALICSIVFFQPRHNNLNL